MQSDGTDPTPLTRTPFEQVARQNLVFPPRNTRPCFSPDGQRIAYASSAHGARGENRFEIYLMDADGSDQRRLTHTEGSSNYHVWHRGGRWIAFTTWFVSHNPRVNRNDIRMVGTRTGQETVPRKRRRGELARQLQP
jgi:Tol biopolymer transport system component